MFEVECLKYIINYLYLDVDEVFNSLKPVVQDYHGRRSFVTSVHI